jgi:hypothetical protein
MATQKLATLDEKIAALAEIRRELAETLEWFQTSRRVRKR